MRKVAAAALALGLILGTATAGAHDDSTDGPSTKFEATLVADADPGDFGVGSATGSFVVIEASGGGSVRMSLDGVTDAGGMPATAPMSELVVTGLVNGAPFAKTFLFDLTSGTGTVDDSLGLADGDLLEIQGVSVSSPGVGVFAVPGLGGGTDDDDDDDHGRHGSGHHRGWGHGRGHDDLVVAAQGRGRGHGHGHGCGRRTGEGTFRAPLVADADAGDWGVDSAMGSFVTIEGEEGGEVKMRLAGVTDGTGAPVQADGSQLIIVGTRNGTPFTTVFPFDLCGGTGKVRGSLELAEGDVVEILMVTVSDGTSVFAVPGLFVRGSDDDDHDGVPDGGDACSGSDESAMVAGDGCSLWQRCTCQGSRHALRACLKNAARAIKLRVKAACSSGKMCRRQVRGVAIERRAVLRSCSASARR